MISLFAVAREFTPRTTCFVNVSSSSPEIVDPYGGKSNKYASSLYNTQIKPFNTLLGFGAGPMFRGMESKLNSGQAQGPLADLIRGIQGFAPNTIGQASSIGNQVAAATPGVYNDVKNQIQSALQGLPAMQAGAGQASNLALQGLHDAYSPVRDSAIFNQTANRVLTPLRASEAARGLEAGGAGQAAETRVLEDLGLSQAQNSLTNQANAQATYGGVLNNQLGLNTAGIGIANAGYQNIQQLAAGLASQYQIPMAAASALASILTGGQQGQLALVQGTAPTVSQSSSGVGVL